LLNNQVSRSEKLWLLKFVLLVLLLISVPYWIGYTSAGTGWRFTGFIFGVEDGNSYIAKMLSGASGNWLFRTPYTAAEQNGFLAFLPYLLLGKLTSSPGQHEQLVVLFHMFRGVGGLLLVLATYDFIALFIEQPGWRKAALVVVVLGGGIGWLFFLLFGQGGNRLPLEFYSPETFGFLTLYGIPHLAVARALLLWGFLLYLLPQSENAQVSSAVKGGIIWLLLGFFQPLTVVVGWAVLTAHLALLGVLRWFRNRKTGLGEWDDSGRYARKAIIIGITSAPIVIYTAVSFWTDPFLSGWANQNVILSPPPIDYIFAYGLLLPFALMGIKSLTNRFPLKGVLLVGWLVLLPVLAYAPYNLQRRLPEGGWVVIVVMSFFFLQQWKDTGKRTAAVLLGITIIPTLILVVGGVMQTMEPGEPIFQRVERVSAYEFLKDYAEPDEVVLAAYATSNALPAWAPLRVVAGHGPESIGVQALSPRIERFFQGAASDEERITLLRNQKVRYIIWGPEEMGLSEKTSFNPEEAVYLSHIYTQGSYQIYEFHEDLNVSP
jgi:hypothetical protein